MRVLLDTNIVLDVLLARQPFVNTAAELFGMIEGSQFHGLLCATTITTIDYLLMQSMPRRDAHKAVSKLLELFEIAPVNRAVLEEALKSSISDFEDAVIEQAARLAGAEVIITRNQKDFRQSSLRILGPDEFLSSFPS